MILYNRLLRLRSDVHMAKLCGYLKGHTGEAITCSTHSSTIACIHKQHLIREHTTNMQQHTLTCRHIITVSTTTTYMYKHAHTYYMERENNTLLIVRKLVTISITHMTKMVTLLSYTLLSRLSKTHKLKKLKIPMVIICKQTTPELVRNITLQLLWVYKYVLLTAKRNRPSNEIGTTRVRLLYVPASLAKHRVSIKHWSSRGEYHHR